MVELTIESTADSEVQHEFAAAVEAIWSSYLRGRRQFMGQRLPSRSPADRRDCERHPIDIPFYLSPMRPSEDGFQLDRNQVLQGVTRDISPRGIGFCCDVPLEESQWLAEFDCATGARVCLVIEIRWCHKKSSRCFLAGARFLELWTAQSDLD
jgi:hypothetical protein